MTEVNANAKEVEHRRFTDGDDPGENNDITMAEWRAASDRLIAQNMEAYKALARL